MKNFKTVYQSWFGCGARWLLSAILFLAAIPKLFNPADFAQVISMYGIVPNSLTFETAIALIAAELITAVGLLLNRFWAVVSAAIILLLFLAVLAYGIYLGLDIDCGCFGPEDPEQRSVSGLRDSFVRDLLLLIPVIYLLMTSNRKRKHIIED